MGEMNRELRRKRLFSRHSR